MILIVDNYDSFTYNLVQLLAPFEVPAKVIRNDAMTAGEALALKPGAVLLSPGPCTPDEAGICLDLVALSAERGVPLLGVCLGHQAIAQAFGGKVVRAGRPMHGKVSPMRHGGSPLFEGIPTKFEATRYHSLSVERDSLPERVEVLAEAEDDGEIMALRARDTSVYGVQYHPESYLSPSGGRLLGNFLGLARLGAKAA
jgi:anthranilate synthase/aminodeoxychorismate synthase-like glutamine amidotransferase